MIPISWPEFCHLHPFVPLNQAEGYLDLISQLERWLSQLTGFAATSLQPNAGSQGEYSGLLVIKKYLESKGERKIIWFFTTRKGMDVFTLGPRVG